MADHFSREAVANVTRITSKLHPSHMPRTGHSLVNLTMSARHQIRTAASLAGWNHRPGGLVVSLLRPEPAGGRTDFGARSSVVSYETIREWSLRFGRTYAKTLKRRRPKPGDKWFLDEVFVRIQGKLHYLWRAVDQHGNMLDVLVQSRRNTKAAKRFFRKLLKGLCYVPRVIVTDKPDSMAPAKARSTGVEHRQSRYLNNRCEVSHQLTRWR